MRGSEAELPPGLELPRISALAYGAGHTGRALPRVAPGLRMDVGGKGPASVTDCMSTESESRSPEQREKGYACLLEGKRPRFPAALAIGPASAPAACSPPPERKGVGSGKK